METETVREEVMPARSRPEWADVDLDQSRRPGRLRVNDPKPLPNTSFPPEQQPGAPASLMHNRPGKVMTPVFGTSCPPRGLSGAIKRLAHSLPDHKPEHWLLLMLSDRVESMGVRARKLAPLAALAGAIWLVKKLA